MDATDWDAEFAFWHRIITEEVERLRFNQGFEPIYLELYPIELKNLAFLGKAQVGRTRFNAAGRWGFDSAGKKVLKISVLKES